MGFTMSKEFSKYLDNSGFSFLELFHDDFDTHSLSALIKSAQENVCNFNIVDDDNIDIHVKLAIEGIFETFHIMSLLAESIVVLMPNDDGKKTIFLNDVCKKMKRVSVEVEESILRNLFEFADLENGGMVSEEGKYF